MLGFGLREAIDASGHEDTAVLATLRREDGGPERFALALAQAHAAGVPIDWQAFFEATAAKAVALPTYPFQRKRYWLSAAAGAGRPRRRRPCATPSTRCWARSLEDPAGERLTLTGRLSLATHPWLADHAVAGTVLAARHRLLGAGPAGRRGGRLPRRSAS